MCGHFLRGHFYGARGRGVGTEPIANCPPPEESNFTVVLPEAPRNDSFLRLSVHVYQTCPTVPPGRGATVERVSNALPHTRAHHTCGRARLDRAPASHSRACMGVVPATPKVTQPDRIAPAPEGIYMDTYLNMSFTMYVLCCSQIVLIITSLARGIPRDPRRLSPCTRKSGKGIGGG